MELLFLWVMYGQKDVGLSPVNDEPQFPSTGRGIFAKIRIRV